MSFPLVQALRGGLVIAAVCGAAAPSLAQSTSQGTPPTAPAATTPTTPPATAATTGSGATTATTATATTATTTTTTTTTTAVPSQPVVRDTRWSDGSSYGSVSVGRSHFGTSCGNVAGLTCRSSGTAASLTAGDMFSEHLGAEVSYLNFGSAQRAGGTVSAQALDVAVVGRLPVGEHLVFRGKVGATWGRTKVSASTAAGLVTGRETGWGLGYGVGADYRLTRRLDATLEWQRHDLRFAGQGTSPVSMVTAGIGYRF